MRNLDPRPLTFFYVTLESLTIDRLEPNDALVVAIRAAKSTLRTSGREILMNLSGGFSHSRVSHNPSSLVNGITSATCV